jgi:hypothetical protein
LTITTGEDLNRTTSGRFVRNLALSLSGGALLTLLGASAAHADDLADAGTTSDGAGTAHSGDATAIGNQSGTNSNQTVTVSGNLGTIQVINQNANVSNVGAGVSNSGGNIAIGNGSVNTAEGEQTGGNGLGPATNTGTAGNTSNGSAAVSTGNASSIGNQSNTTINQTAHGSAHGQLGGILVINQNANVLNSGVALSNTGGNAAVGNVSNNTAGLLQDANTAAGIAANSGKATNNSDGKATISTGNGSATGNKSDTTINQTATGSAGGALGGLVIIDQNAFVANTGVAVANTGGNLAVGNASDNGDQNGGDEGAFLEQNIGDPNAPDIIGVASNNGEASNWSDGSANIRTGDATAIGNDSRTTVNQTGDADIEGPGGAAIVSQGSNVLNIGLAAANSGGNLALGNTSDSSAFTEQDAPSGGGIAVGVVGQFGLASNNSDGSANIDSGNAWANGNQSETNVSQKSSAEGGAFNLLPQVNSVQNFGVSAANSGLNLANGNDSSSDADVFQEASLPAEALGVGVVGNFGMASNTSDGSASVTTGDATATGNKSKTVISQDLDPTGLVIPVQVANVTNAGFAVANSGLNAAGGNASINEAVIEDQTASIGQDNNNDPLIIAGTIVASNNGEASNASDGSASIHTGNATATGNESATEIGQTSAGHIDGLGFIVNTQAATVLNAGVGLANSGLNFAEGNGSFNDAVIEDQIAEVGSDNDADDITLIGGVITAANNGTASNASDGTASVHTGDASGVGNRSDTKIRQEEGGDISGLGAVINTQVAVVGNTGLGIGNSGGNAAIGNFSDNGSSLDQHARVASDNDLTGSDDITVIGSSLIANNSGESSNTSDGTGNISTGSAEGIGNTSSTHIDQATGGDISGAGLVLNTQVAGVANVGLGVANSGVNFAVGNASDNYPSNPGNPGADLEQEAQVASSNDMNDDINVIGLPPGGSITANNSGEASNTSDGTANVITGAAQGQGNVSATIISQDPDSSIDGAGLVIGTQLAGVANVGVGVANSGFNAAVGNISGDAIGPNEADADQVANIGSDNDDGPVSLVAFGPITASNNGVASNESDGTAKVKTGGALATGNASATNITQAQSGGVSGLGVVIGTQVGGVANVGVGVANSGLNLAVGNASTSQATLTGDGGEQAANVISDNGDPTEAVVLGSVTAANDGEASNSSDGEACVCTGAAFASGNVSSTTLVQDLNLHTDGGLVLVTEAGGVLNAGVGVANSGLNLALGNISTNDSTLVQDATINDALLPIAPSQTAHNGGTASNASDGKGLVASGNAKATGNLSTTNFAQAADVDSALAVSTISGGTTNAGIGLANAGLNLGIGNASTNSAFLEQDADGSGIVNNDGTASNESDGEAIIGDPSKCDDVPGTTPEAPKPGAPGLPRTGGPIEAEAAIALMLLLMGFGLRRRGQKLA